VSFPLITGTARIVTEPRRRVTKTNEPWASVIARFIGYRKTDAGKWGEDTSFSASITAFGDPAPALFTFAKGDDIELHGKVRDVTFWQPPTGAPRPQLQIAAATVVEVARQRGRSRQPVAV
jgi:hypothetical protein